MGRQKGLRPSRWWRLPPYARRGDCPPGIVILGAHYLTRGILLLFCGRNLAWMDGDDRARGGPNHSFCHAP